MTALRGAGKVEPAPRACRAPSPPFRVPHTEVIIAQTAASSFRRPPVSHRRAGHSGRVLCGVGDQARNGGDFLSALAAELGELCQGPVCSLRVAHHAVLPLDVPALPPTPRPIRGEGDRRGLPRRVDGDGGHPDRDVGHRRRVRGRRQGQGGGAGLRASGRGGPASARRAGGAAAHAALAGALVVPNDPAGDAAARHEPAPCSRDRRGPARADYRPDAGAQLLDRDIDRVLSFAPRSHRAEDLPRKAGAGRADGP